MLQGAVTTTFTYDVELRRPLPTRFAVIAMGRVGGAETGFGSADAMRHHFRQRLGTSPAHYRAAFRAPAH